jgi:hypothetical protein
LDLVPWFLFAHVLGAIIAFGPTFVFPIIGRLGGREREHANFATRLSLAISEVQVIPFAILQGITGVGLVITGKIDVLQLPWLLIAIVLYAIALGYGIFVQAPTVRRVIALTSGGPPAGGPAVGGPAAGGPPPGPPPQLLALIRRVQLGGFFMAALVIVIVFLMVVKPAF